MVRVPAAVRRGLDRACALIPVDGVSIPGGAGPVGTL